MRRRLDEPNPSHVEQLLIMPSDVSSVTGQLSELLGKLSEPGLGKLSSNPLHFIASSGGQERLSGRHGISDPL